MRMFLTEEPDEVIDRQRLVTGVLSLNLPDDRVDPGFLFLVEPIADGEFDDLRVHFWLVSGVLSLDFPNDRVDDQPTGFGFLFEPNGYWFRFLFFRVRKRDREFKGLSVSLVLFYKPNVAAI